MANNYESKEQGIFWFVRTSEILGIEARQAVDQAKQKYGRQQQRPRR